MDREAIRQRITDLVNDFRANYHQHKKELEANTETKLVEPLFAILGWTTKDFVKREQARRGTGFGLVDYAFKIDDRVVFFLEVKKLGVELAKEADTQVISYALSRRIPFAVSTNFENLKIFCVEQENAVNNVFRVFKRPEDYVDNLQDLLFLHKESFEQNLLLKKAEDEGRLKKRTSIDRPLLEDLMSIRNMIANDIEKRYPGKYDLNEREEIIQRIVDRLIFVRKCEDVGINPDELMLEEIAHNPYGKAHSKLKEIFKRYNEVYNGGLFAAGVDNDCDKIVIDGEIVQKLSRLLYESKDRQYVYNFDWIDADILGQVYEQYLGKILAQTKSGKSRLKNGQAHRKEEGIYYTPTYVVDYIVNNTLGNLLRNKRIDAKKIKVLDPACGSGSFLIKAFDYLRSSLYLDDESAIRRIDEQGMYSVKTTILKNNIYGVDLDPKAVEITKLNLLLKAAEKFRKLPEDIELHIKHGNSLIDDESVAGLVAFKWIGHFQEGSFDVVIGNPPYINAMQLTKSVGEEVKEYWKKKFATARGAYDIYVLFFEEALKICKDGGFVSFITPNKYLSSPYGEALREHITKNYKLVKIVDLSRVKVFDDPAVYPVITIIQKSKPTKEYTIISERMLSEDTKDKKTYEISSKTLTALPNHIWGILLSDNVTVIKRIFAKCKPLEEVAEVQATSTAAEADEYSGYINENKSGLPIINTGTIDRYLTTYGITKFMNKGQKLQMPHLDASKISDKRRGLYQTPKIVLAKLALRIEGFVDDVGAYASINTNCIHTPKKDYSIEYLAGLINSKLMSFIYSELFSGLKMSAGYFQFQAPQIRILPIAESTKDKQDRMISLVKEIISLNEHLRRFGDKKTSDRTKVEEQISKTDGEIDRLVYEVYGLTDEEIRIVEDFIASLERS